jgi:hypothetical protein
VQLRLFVVGVSIDVNTRLQTLAHTSCARSFQHAHLSHTPPCICICVSPHTTAHSCLCLPTDNFDSHNAQRMACHNKAECYGRGPAGVADNVPFAWDEGDVQIGPGASEPHTDRLALHQRRSSIFMITISTRTHHLSGHL